MITRRQFADEGYSDWLNVYDKNTLKCYDIKNKPMHSAFTSYVDGTSRFPKWLEGRFIVDYTYLKRKI